MEKTIEQKSESISDNINVIAVLHFKEMPVSIERVTIGLCNEVFDVKFKDREVIVRLSQKDVFMKGSQKHIPILKERGINVPDILAEDYTKINIPYSYQFLSKLKGKDIGPIIEYLSDKELEEIAKEIGGIIKIAKTIPASEQCGYFYDEYSETTETWVDWIKKIIDIAMERGNKTGVMDDDMHSMLLEISHDNENYFNQIKPTTYLDDICSKNVMIDGGKFSGLVDLDCFAQGDYLESIGRMKASWPRTHYGEVYTNAVMNELKLNNEQRKVVTMYALLNRISWACENGIQFNQNTTGIVDQEREKKDKEIIDMLYNEFKYNQ
ncbi:hypothetical protein A3I18_01125 [Candidatus Campbellbacteria bacterium RIFCSPLOWO2_02_FULL_35_11]|uniref:Aminoglycoside phosphotransferase domain-containing protein n=1 Tax=Candidatus Campbellbacteria bacterium RIFCSPLOWO2_02_FULL_35_11 TaxID=1797581 RepID=A0A1F5EQQ3_9BACT|nr:MAG: hypothetical protein A3I18_01125 [Candidatus Campbellbacteria bacterium RIFCSPLOWO2_02_FULL_35_11]